MWQYSLRMRTLLVGLLVLGLSAACSQAPAQQPRSSGPAASAPAASAPAPAAAQPAAPAPGAPQAAPATEPRLKFDIGHLPGAAFQWGSYVALDKGFFTTQGLDLEVVQIGTPNEAARAVVSNSVN